MYRKTMKLNESGKDAQSITTDRGKTGERSIDIWSEPPHLQAHATHNIERKSPDEREGRRV